MQYQIGGGPLPAWSPNLRRMEKTPPTADESASSQVLERLARNLRWVREIVSPSAAEMARKLGLANANQLTRYETAERKPDNPLLTRFCDLTGCTMDFLWRNRLQGMDEDLKLRLVAIHPELVLGSDPEDTPPAKPARLPKAGTSRAADN